MLTADAIGRSVRLKLLRSGKLIELDVTLTQRPVEQ
jgi:hypothetical protein